MATAITVEDYGGANVARISAVLRASGEAVAAEEVVFEIENHKAVQELESPGAGVLAHGLSVGDHVRLGVPIAYVAEGGEDVEGLAARARAEALHQDGWTGEIASPPVRGDSPGEPVSLRKATEIAVLGNGAGASMLSTLGAAIGPVRRDPATPDFFSNKILDLVVFEASRLLAGDYKRLNAWFEDGRVITRGPVHAGVGFDDGARLTLYTVEDAQALSLADTQDEIVGGLMRYVGQSLAPDQVSRSSFTVSDLSASQLIFSFPLLPRGQCVIIAVTKSEAGDYALYVSFDHRVTEGMPVAAFTTELVARIRSFSVAEPAAAAAAEDPPSCAWCGRTVEEETALGGKGLLRVAEAGGNDGFCCSACWGGW